MPKLRFNTRTLLAALILASLLFGCIGLQIAACRSTAATIERLSKIGVTVYATEPSVVGAAAARLPTSANDWLASAMGEEVLTSPTTILATGVQCADFERLVDLARQLPDLDAIVVLDHQLNDGQLDWLSVRLPNVRILQAAFVSGVIMTR